MLSWIQARYVTGDGNENAAIVTKLTLASLGTTFEKAFSLPKCSSIAYTTSDPRDPD